MSRPSITPLAEVPQNDAESSPQPIKLPDFANAEEVVTSAINAWIADDQDLFNLHFYLRKQDGEPAFNALNQCNIQNSEGIDYQTKPATDIGPQMSTVSISLDGNFISSFLIVDANRFRIGQVDLNCSN